MPTEPNKQRCIPLSDSLVAFLKKDARTKTNPKGKYTTHTREILESYRSRKTKKVSAK